MIVPHPASADPLGSGDLGFTGTYDPVLGVVQLSWDMPDTASSAQLWRNGELLATVTGDSYTDAGPAAANGYSLVVTTASGTQSAVMVVIIIGACADTDVGCIFDHYVLHCPPLGTGTDDEPPYVAVGVHDECMPNVPPDLP